MRVNGCVSEWVGGWVRGKSEWVYVCVGVLAVCW